jgi:predicted permease
VGTLWQDIRFGLRTLRKNRGFTAFAVLTLALGIGVTTAMFSLVVNVVLRPLPILRPSELVAISSAATKTAPAKPGISWQMYLDYRDSSAASFAGISGYKENIPSALSHDSGSTVSGDAAVVTGNYFDVLGVRAFRGRMISAQDDSGAGDSNVVVISHRVWREFYGGRANALGSILRINGSSYTVIGVAPADFSGISLDSSPDVWIPMSSVIHGNTLVAMMAKSVDSTVFHAVGRIKPGLTMAQARQPLNVAAIQLGAGKSVSAGLKTVGGRSVPDLWEKPEPELQPLENARGGSSRASTILLFGSITLLLLLVVCDIASMQLARFERRRREVAIRLALGASRVHVARAIVVEGLLLSMFGAVAGLFVAYWSLKLFVALLPLRVQWHTSLLTSFLEGRALLFTIFITLFAGVFFSLAPAIRAARSNVLLAMNSDTPTTATGRPRGAARRIDCVSNGGLRVAARGDAAFSTNVLERIAFASFVRSAWRNFVQINWNQEIRGQQCRDGVLGQGARQCTKHTGNSSCRTGFSSPVAGGESGNAWRIFLPVDQSKSRLL